MYKALLLDLDDTLVNSGQVYDRALRFSSDFLAEKYNLNRDDFYKIVYEKHLIVHRNFPTVHTRHSRILVFRLALEDVMDDYDLALLPDVEDLYWDFFMKNIKVYPGVTDALEFLGKRGVKIAVVSDGSLELRIRKLKTVGLLQYLDELVASEEVIFEKPFSAIFTLALSRLKVEPENAVMLGNDYKSDVRGAQLVGLKAGIFDPAEDGNVIGQDGTIKEDFIIKKFGDIIDIMGAR